MSTVNINTPMQGNSVHVELITQISFKYDKIIK